MVKKIIYQTPNVVNHWDCWLNQNHFFLKKVIIAASIVHFIKMATLLLLCLLLLRNINECLPRLRFYVMYYQHIYLSGIGQKYTHFVWFFSIIKRMNFTKYRKPEWGRSLLLRTGRDSPQSFIGVSIMFLMPPNVKSTPFAGKNLQGRIPTNHLLIWCFVFNGGHI